MGRGLVPLGRLRLGATIRSPCSPEKLFTGTRSARATVTGVTTLSLPTQAGVPVDSPELVRDELPAGRGAVTLRDWTVPTVSLDPDAALGCLRDPVPSDLTPGATVRHLREVAAFAEDLVSRGRLLPVVIPGPLPSAAWRPVLAAADARWAQALALALPPAGRAAGGSPADLVADALDALVDASARSTLRARQALAPATCRRCRGPGRPGARSSAR